MIPITASIYRTDLNYTITDFKLNLIRACICMLLTLGVNATFGQENKPKGTFLTDSIEVGKPLFYVLSYSHAPNREVFFPDSTYNFTPFEIISKKSFPSVTNAAGTTTIDSAIYQLVTFDVSPVQTLQVPIFIFAKGDSTPVFGMRDSVFLKKNNLNPILLKESLQPSVALAPLNSNFNFSRLFGTLAIILGVIIIIYWVFGKDIYKQWRLIKLQRRHLEYLRSFNRLLRNAREKNNIKDAENAIIVWKNYLERLEKKPFATYTTREIIDNMPDDALAQALKKMDGIIYGQVKSNNMDTFLEVLKTGATKLYRSKRRQILDNPVS